MVYTIHDPRLFYDAVVARLSAATGSGGTGRPIGEAVAPEAATAPYAVVYPMPDIVNDGSLNNPTRLSVYQWQVTAVGQSMEQAQWMQQKIRAVLLGWTPTVAGIGSTPVDLEEGSGITRDDDVSPPLFYSTDRFRMYASS